MLTPPNSHSIKRAFTRFVALGLAAYLAACATPASHTQVLIVASAYEQTRDERLRLYNTSVDAQAVNDLFKRRIARTEVTLVEDPTPSAWLRGITDFTARIRPTDTAVIYYAGHAVQKDGQNYFLSADGNALALISADEVLSLIMAARPRATIFFIDACRNNPFRSESSASANVVPVQDLQVKSLSRGIGPLDYAPAHEVTISTAALSASSGGLSQMSNVRGRNAIVFFSTDPGNVALDGTPGRGSPFANVLALELTKQVTLDEALRSVTQGVNTATEGRQSPWRQGDLGFSLYLAGPPVPPPPVVTPP